MTEGNSCCCSSGSTILIFACSGSSNVGQITHSAALRLARNGAGKMSCLAGVGAHLSGFVVSAKDCDKLVVLDGCDQNCALKIFEHVDIKPHVYVNLMEKGFVKRHGVPVKEEKIEKACALVMDLIKE